VCAASKRRPLSTPASPKPRRSRHVGVAASSTPTGVWAVVRIASTSVPQLGSLIPMPPMCSPEHARGSHRSNCHRLVCRM
jgi:hypothetical protein